MFRPCSRGRLSTSATQSINSRLAEAELFRFDECEYDSRDVELRKAFLRHQGDGTELPFEAPDQLFEVRRPASHATYFD
jgi:hypothetical protein